MNLKPMLLGIVAAALVTTAIVKVTTEGDKFTFAPAPVVEMIPMPMVPPAPIKFAPKAAVKRAVPIIKPAVKCPARAAH